MNTWTKLGRRVTIGAALVAGAVGCQTMSEHRVASGAAIGAATGAAAGAIIGHQSGNAGRGAAIGAAVGGLAGAGIGAYLNHRAAQRLEQIQGVEAVQVTPAPASAQSGGTTTATSEPAVGRISFRMRSDMLFPVGSATISPQGAAALDQVAAVLADYPDTHVQVRGYASAEGDEQRNLQLSRERAEAVRNYLISRRIRPERITAIGMGIGNPIGDNSTEAGRAMNRRVEIEVFPASEMR